LRTVSLILLVEYLSLRIRPGKSRAGLTIRTFTSYQISALLQSVASTRAVQLKEAVVLPGRILCRDVWPLLVKLNPPAAL